MKIEYEKLGTVASLKYENKTEKPFSLKDCAKAVVSDKCYWEYVHSTGAF